MKKITIVILGFVLGCTIRLHAQNSENYNGLFKLVEAQKAEGVLFESYQIFESIPGNSYPNLDELEDYELYNFNSDAFTSLYNNKPDAITTDIYIGGAMVTLELVRADILSDGFTVQTKTGDGQNPEDANLSEDKYGVHYQGIVSNSPMQSIVALSIFEDQVYGLISTDNIHNFSIGKLRNSDIHLGYSSEDYIPGPPETDCDIEGVDIYEPGELPEAYHEDVIPVDKCITNFFEVENDIHQFLGSNINNTVAYTVSLFNQSACVFKNDGVSMYLDIVMVWSTMYSPVGLGDADSRLTNFQNMLVSFSSDIAHFINAFNDNGKAGSFGGVPYCGDANSRMCVSGIKLPLPLQSPIPNYAHSIFIITHEPGHLLGSRHTQACVWNGNNTAIDGCVPSEGSCPNGPLPGANEGTIMSYCALPGKPGVDLHNGFGPQPGDLIRNAIHYSTCLYGCDRCHPYLVLYTSPQYLNLYRVDDYITSSAQISNLDKQVTYDAGQKIIFEPGFEVTISQAYPYGKHLYAKIEGCNSSSGDGGAGEKPGKGQTVSENKVFNSLISVYPNPTSGSFTIELPDADKYKIKIMNMMGSVVYESNIYDVKKTQVELSHKLSAGTYTIHISSDDANHIEKITLIR